MYWTDFEQCKKNGYSLILTSDHGNAENMFDEKNIACTTHSLNLVPFTICEKINYSIETGKLADIAPTVLKLLDLEIPTVMKGKPLLNDTDFYNNFSIFELIKFIGQKHRFKS